MQNQAYELCNLKEKNVCPTFQIARPTGGIQKFYEVVRAITIILLAVGWCVLLFFTIKGGFEHNEIEAGKVQAVNNIASILYKLANINILPISSAIEKNSAVNQDLLYILAQLNGRNSSETGPNLLYSRKSGLVWRGGKTL